MKCTKCGSEMRLESEEYCKDVNGRAMYKNFAYCDTCRTKTELIQNSSTQVNHHPQKRKHGCLTAILIIILLLVLFTVIGIVIGASNKIVPENSVTNTEKSSVAKKYLNISGKKGKKIDSILLQCGLTDITEIKHDKMLDEAHSAGETGYRITSNEIKNIILYLDKKDNVSYLIYANHKLYKKGKYKASLNDYTITTKEISKWQTYCEEYIKSILKSPSTADFPLYDEWKYSKNKNKLIVQSYVDSQNGFGATVRSNFQFTINIKTEAVTSLIVNGEEIIQ